MGVDVNKCEVNSEEGRDGRGKEEKEKKRKKRYGNRMDGKRKLLLRKEWKGKGREEKRDGGRWE